MDLAAEGFVGLFIGVPTGFRGDTTTFGDALMVGRPGFDRDGDIALLDLSSLLGLREGVLGAALGRGTDGVLAERE